MPASGDDRFPECEGVELRDEGGSGAHPLPFLGKIQKVRKGSHRSGAWRRVEGGGREGRGRGGSRHLLMLTCLPGLGGPRSPRGWPRERSSSLPGLIRP